MSDNRAALDQFMRTMESRTREIVRQEMRAKTGVIPGGPYGSFSVDSQGRVTNAGVGGGGVTGLAIYSRLYNQSIPNSTDTIIDYDTVVSDSGGLVTTGASWHYTAPTTGIYIIFGTLIWSAINWTAGQETSMKVFADGFQVDVLDWQTHGQGAASVRTLHGTVFFQCNAGALLDIEAYQEKGSSQDIYQSTVAIWCLIPV